MRNKDCAFCNFKDKQVVISEDKVCYSIISKDPINKYHVLVIPKNHYTSFRELPAKVASHLFLVTKNLSSAVRNVCKPDAVTHLSDDDITGGFNLMEHYKIHIIPRYKKDKVKIEWNRDPDPGLSKRSEFAEAVRKHLK